MDGFRKHMRYLSVVMTIMLTLAPVWPSLASANLVGTGDMIAGQQVQLDRQQLLTMLSSPEVQDKMAKLGVSEEQVTERIQNLTAQELAQLEQQLGDAPAGQSVVGALVLIFVVLVVTDMLCATDIFPFVKCIR